MAYYKKIFILFFILILCCSFCFASEEEDVTLSSINGLAITANSNYYTSNSDILLGYCQLEKGYIYTVHNDNTSSNTVIAFSNDIPSLNLPYYDRVVISPGEYYSFVVDDSFTYIVLSGNNFDNPQRYVTRRVASNESSAISDLVDNVGPNVLWNVFGNTTSYILIVVFVALGLFLLVCAIRGISKTKSKF